MRQVDLLIVSASFTGDTVLAHLVALKMFMSDLSPYTRLV